MLIVLIFQVERDLTWRTLTFIFQNDERSLTPINVKNVKMNVKKIILIKTSVLNNFKIK